MNWVISILKWVRSFFWHSVGPSPQIPVDSPSVEVPDPVVVEVPDPVVVVPPPDPTPDPPTVPVVNALPVLSVPVGSRFLRAPDGAVVDYRESSAMGLYALWLQDQKDEIDALLSYFQTRKINAIRPLFNLTSDFWTNMGRRNTHLDGDHWWEQLVPFINHVASFGIYTRCCLFGGVEEFVGHQLDWGRRPDVVSDHPDVIAKMHAYVEQFIEATSESTSVLYEVANEPSQIGFGYNSGVVVALGCRIKELAPNRVMNFGAATDEDNTFFAQLPADFLDEHLRRMPDWDYQASIKRLIHHAAVDQKTMAFCSGEWMNLGNVTRPGRGDADGTRSTATAFASAAMLRLKHCIPAFHATCLLSPDLPDTVTDQALVAWSKGLDLIPIEIAGAGVNGHWAESPFDSDIFPPSDAATDEWNGPVRIYGLVGPDGYLGVSIREPAGYPLVGDEVDIETVYLEQWGQWQSRIIKA